ncbi:MAG: uroporphyrinogen-III synthase [Pseudomonadota bacterium]
MKILVTRPQPEAQRQAAILRDRGHEVIVSPLLDCQLIAPSFSNVPPPDALAGVIATSRNALRGFAKALGQRADTSKWTAVPLFCVGENTAALATDLGFKKRIAGDGNAVDLAAFINRKISPDAGHLLRLDREHEQPDPLIDALRSDGFMVSPLQTYRIKPVSQLSEEAQQAMERGTVDCVVLMSPATARAFCRATACGGVNLESEHTVYACLSSAVADALPRVPARCKFIADKPNQAGILSVVDRAVARQS